MREATGRFLGVAVEDLSLIFKEGMIVLSGNVQVLIRANALK